MKAVIFITLACIAAGFAFPNDTDIPSQRTWGLMFRLPGIYRPPASSGSACTTVATCCKVQCTTAAPVCVTTPATGAGLAVCGAMASTTPGVAGTYCRDATVCPACSTFTCTPAAAAAAPACTAAPPAICAIGA